MYFSNLNYLKINSAIDEKNLFYFSFNLTVVKMFW
jgi:hypothetical protein